MSEKQFEDDGVKYTNNYNYTLLDTYYEFDDKRIIEWNKHSSNAEYTDFERITEILNIKQMRLESLMKHREEIGKLFDRIDEQQATISQLQDLCGESDGENAKLRLKNEKLQDKIDWLCEKIKRLEQENNALELNVKWFAHQLEKHYILYSDDFLETLETIEGEEIVEKMRERQNKVIKNLRKDELL